MAEQQKKPIKVTVSDMKPMTGWGNMRAFVTVQIGPLRIKKCRLVKEENKSAWVSPPQEMWEKNGKKSYFPLVEWPQEWNDAINDAVLTAYADATGEGL
jgi:DNA-binding cell septation regulator SpoVG